jgi:hypothetical protein
VGLIETLLGRLFSFVADLVGGALALRPVVHLRTGVWEKSELGFAQGGSGMSIWSRDGALWIHNGGRQDFTVNEAGWIAADGTRLNGQPEHGASATLKPGGPELRYTLKAPELVTLHDEHGGIGQIFAQLAGATKPRMAKVPAGWIADLREVAAKPTAVHFGY